MDALLAKLFDISPLVGVLAIVIWYFYARDKRNDARAESREKMCEDRNTKLDERIQLLEKRQFEHLNDIAERGLTELAASTAAIKQFMRDQSVTPPRSFPTRKDGT